MRDISPRQRAVARAALATGRRSADSSLPRAPAQPPLPPARSWGVHEERGAGRRHPAGASTAERFAPPTQRCRTRQRVAHRPQPLRRSRRGSRLGLLVRVVVLVLLQVVEYFFENQERCGLGECLLLTRELALQPPNALRRRDRSPAFLVEREPPLLEFREEEAFLLE